MGKAKRRGDHAGRPGWRRDASVNPELERLGQRFTQFRREHPPQTRIPLQLRDAVLAVMAHGATTTQVRHACGLSASQLDRWQRYREKAARHAVPRRAAPRVFAVVPDALAGAAEPDDDRAAPEIELRLGGWSIRIRSDEA